MNGVEPPLKLALQPDSSSSHPQLIVLVFFVHVVESPESVQLGAVLSTKTLTLQFVLLPSSSSIVI